MAKAKVTFHIYDEKTNRPVVFTPGDEVPAHLAKLVGDHCLEGKAPARSKADDEDGN